MTSIVVRNSSTSSELLVTNTTAQMQPEYQPPFSEAAVIISACIILPLMVLGIVGNLLTIVTIGISTKLTSVFNLFILSLSISDLMSALISPLLLYRRTWGYDEWNIPSFFCKLYWSTDMWTSYVTALHILGFAILRLISIRWPHSYRKITRVHTRICIVMIWLVAFLVGFIPFALWYDSGKRRRNSDDRDAKWPACTLDKNWVNEYTLYSRIAYPIFYYVPMVSIIALTMIIGLLLYLRSREQITRREVQPPPGTESRMKKTARKEKEAMLQLALIAGSFVVGYLPFSAYEITSMTSPPEADAIYWWNFGMIGYICLRVSETLNPVFYNLASTKMRRETKGVLMRACRAITSRCQNDFTSEISSSTHDRFSGVNLET